MSILSASLLLYCLNSVVFDHPNNPYRIGLIKSRYPAIDQKKKLLVRNTAMNSLMRAEGQKYHATFAPIPVHLNPSSLAYLRHLYM